MPQNRQGINSYTLSGRLREEPAQSGAPGNIPSLLTGRPSNHSQHDRGPEVARRHTAPNRYRYHSFQAPDARYQGQSNHTVTPTNAYHPHQGFYPPSGPHPPYFIPPPGQNLLPGVYPPIPYLSAPTYGHSGFPLPGPYYSAQAPAPPGNTQHAHNPKSQYSNPPIPYFSAPTYGHSGFPLPGPHYFAQAPAPPGNTQHARNAKSQYSSAAPSHIRSHPPPSGSSGYLYPFRGGVPPGPLPYGPPLSFPVQRLLDSGDVLFDKWAAGPDYGPVLTPLQVGILDVKVQINPLLAPSADAVEKPAIEYNILLHVGTARRSTDPRGKAWIAGRSAPATFPRVTKLTLISKYFSWIISIEAKDPQLGVTCSDVLHGIHDDMDRITPRYQIEALPARDFHLLMTSYTINRSTARHAPGGEFGAAVKRGDSLHRNIMFDGIVEDDAFTMRKLVASGPGWKGLQKDDKKSRRGYPVTFVLNLDQVIVDPIYDPIYDDEKGSEPSTDANCDDT